MSQVKNDAKKKSAGEMSVSVSFCYVTTAPKLGGLNDTYQVCLVLDSVGWLEWLDEWNDFSGLGWLNWGCMV